MVPHEIPRSTAVPASLKNALAYHRRDGCTARSAWIVTAIDCMLTLSPRPSTRVRKNAKIRLLASVISKNPARTAQTVPLAMVATSHGKRKRKATSGDASRTWVILKPIDSNSASVSSLSAMSNASSVNSPTSTTPVIRLSASTTGNARSLCITNASQASMMVAVAGMDSTRRAMMSPSFTSGAEVRRRLVGTTPTKRRSSSTT